MWLSGLIGRGVMHLVPTICVGCNLEKVDRLHEPPVGDIHWRLALVLQVIPQRCENVHHRIWQVYCCVCCSCCVPARQDHYHLTLHANTFGAQPEHSTALINMLVKLSILIKISMLCAGNAVICMTTL